MINYISKRLIQMIVVLIGVTLITFILVNVVPGDPVKLMLDKRATSESISRIRHELGLDAPLPVQYLNFLKKAARLDFGKSFFKHEPVNDLIKRKFIVTGKLAVITYAWALFTGILMGILASVNRGKIIDSALMVLSMLGMSAPAFWIAIILQIVFGLKLNLLPISGLDTFSHYILPAIALGSSYAATTARITRTSMLEVLGQDYIRTVRAKGLSEYKVIFKHAFKNALIPIVTLSGMQLTSILTGSMLIENVFSIPGLGVLTINSIMQRDIPLIQGTVVFTAVIFVFSNLLVDISYAFIDPRVRLAKEV